MRCTAIVLLALLGPASALSVDFSDSAWRTSPITKVVNLLKDMQNQLQTEAKEDESTFEKLGCWCTTNEAEKTKAISDANQRSNDLTAAIEGLAAKSSQLETEIEKLNAQLAKDNDGLAQASEIRTKENAEFQADEKDMTQSATSLGGAVDALSKANGGAASLSQESLVQLKAVLSKHVQKHKAVSQKQHKVIMSFIQEKTSQPQSGAIFGVLKGMKESFETNLGGARADEKEAADAFAELKAAKTKEMAAATQLEENKSVELAEAQNNHAQSKQDLEDTRAQLAADTTFLDNLKDKCNNAAAEYDARQKVRTEEILAVSETIGIITSDESQQAISRSQSFIQMSLHTRRLSAEDRSREKAARVLQKAGLKLSSGQLMALSVSVKQDAFAAVKKSIQTMIDELGKTQKEEFEKHDYCNDELKQNSKSQAQKKDQKAELEQLIADLTTQTANLSDELVALKASVAEMQVQMKKASENREAENSDFQVTVADQKATQAILAKALDRLKSFYEKKALLQTEQMPAQKTYQKSAKSSGVMFMIEGIVKDSKDVERKALQGENDAQGAYEEFISDSNASIEASSQDIMNKSEAKAKADQDKVGAQQDLKATIQDLLKLGEYSVALHQDCDFLLKNFSERQDSRSQEIEALKNALAIFSGSSMGGFLQH